MEGYCEDRVARTRAVNYQQSFIKIEARFRYWGSLRIRLMHHHLHSYSVLTHLGLLYPFFVQKVHDNSLLMYIIVYLSVYHRS